MTQQTLERATWTTAFVDDLPDSSFLYVAPGGTKDSDGKTVPRTLRYFPFKDASGAVDLPHLRNALARIPQSDLSDTLKASLTAKAQKLLPSEQNGGRSARPDEFRARPLGYELRDDGDAMPTLVGTLAVFNEWAEINSASEGHFLERLDPGAFTKTIKESRDSMRVLFQHGKDPAIGAKPLGPIRLLEARDGDVAYEVPLLDTSYNRDIAAMLASDPPVLGSSFQFKVMREHVERRPKRSAYNPKGLAERTVQEVRMKEFGPVTFPAYSGAKATLRSLTDQMTGHSAFPLIALDDLSALERMILLCSDYLEDHDGDAPAMQGVLETLRSLSEESAETEGDEAPSIDHAPLDDAAQEGTSTGTPRTKSWEPVASLNALHVSAREEVSAWSRTT